MISHRYLQWTRHIYERYPFVFHVVGWFIFMTLPYMTFTLPQLLSYKAYVQLFGVKFINEILVIAFFYLNLFKLMPEALHQRKPYRVILSVLGMGAFLMIVNAAYYRYFLVADFSEISARIVQAQVAMIEKESWLTLPLPLIATSLISLVLLTSVSSAFAVYRDRREREAAHQQMVVEKKEAELNALKLQISPHFLFNTLNNIRWLARQKSDATEDAIQRLSDILRYMIYRVDRGPVPLSLEVDYLQGYIQLQQMRLDASNHVNFTSEIDDEDALIEPLLLIHFVENAFKHGLHHQQESTIDIELSLSDGTFFFQTRNRLLEQPLPKGEHSGLGIQNVRRRLAFHYPDRHKLTIQEGQGLFCVSLWIDLKPVYHA